MADLFLRVAPHGVRRRRDDSVEIEELDSRTMRQSSYNYFQHHGNTFRSSLRSPHGRKRQRTLAEQLDELCLGAKGRADRKARRRNGGRIVELDENGQEKPMDSDSDGMDDMDTGVQVYGDVENVGLKSFFGADAHRPMDRMYRHYVAVAQAASAPPQGNEIVVFRQPKAAFEADLPAYLSLTPKEFEKLSASEKKQWYQAHRKYMRELDQAAEKSEGKELMEAKPTEPERRRRSSSASSSRSFQLLGVPSTDEEDDLFADVEMMEDDDEVAAPKRPHAAGALTHTEWFTDDEL